MEDSQSVEKILEKLDKLDLTEAKSEYRELQESGITYNDAEISRSYTNADKTRILSNKLHKTFCCLRCKQQMIFTKTMGLLYINDMIKCNGCGQIYFSQINGVLHCEKCTFDLCSKCRFCPNGHFLKKVFELNIEGAPKCFKTYPNNSFQCEICDEIFTKHNGVYKCWTCDYDVCTTCVLRSKGKIE